MFIPHLDQPAHSSACWQRWYCVVRSWDPRVQELIAWLYHWLAVRPWASHITSLCLHFGICKMSFIFHSYLTALNELLFIKCLEQCLSYNQHHTGCDYFGGQVSITAIVITKVLSSKYCPSVEPVCSDLPGGSIFQTVVPSQWEWREVESRLYQYHMQSEDEGFKDYFSSGITMLWIVFPHPQICTLMP